MPVAFNVKGVPPPVEEVASLPCQVLPLSMDTITGKPGGVKANGSREMFRGGEVQVMWFSSKDRASVGASEPNLHKGM